VKLVRAEPETAALRKFLKDHLLRVTSAVSAVEVRRAVLREGSAEDRKKAGEVLGGVIVIRLTNEILERASALEPPQLRSLDAIQLATALSLVAEAAVELSAFVVYDRRLGDAARAAGVRVVSPGSASS
jgi:predicted nucleic acid-binding protein